MTSNETTIFHKDAAEAWRQVQEWVAAARAAGWEVQSVGLDQTAPLFTYKIVMFHP